MLGNKKKKSNQFKLDNNMNLTEYRNNMVG